MKLFTTTYVPDPKGKYIEIDEFDYTEQKKWVRTGKKLVAHYKFWQPTDIDTLMNNLSTKGLPGNYHPVRMKKKIKLNIKLF